MAVVTLRKKVLYVIPGNIKFDKVFQKNTGKEFRSYSFIEGSEDIGPTPFESYRD